MKVLLVQQSVKVHKVASEFSSQKIPPVSWTFAVEMELKLRKKERISIVNDLRQGSHAVFFTQRSAKKMNYKLEKYAQQSREKGETLHAMEKNFHSSQNDIFGDVAAFFNDRFILCGSYKAGNSEHVSLI